MIPVQVAVLDAATQHRQDLEKILKELKIPELKISVDLKASIVEILDRNFKAFAVNDDDLSVTDRVEHTIDTGTNTPFKERGRPVPFGAREFVEQEIAKYQRLGIVSPADSGNCHRASAIVVGP